MASDNGLLQIEGLCVPLPHGQDRQLAVDDVTLTLNAGEMLCVVGESGSGKSMLANAVMGLLPYYMQASAGRILFKGQNLLEMSEAMLRNKRGQAVSMVFQEPMSALNPLMRVGEQIAEVMAVHGVGTAQSRATRVVELLEYVGLPEPHQLQHAYPFRLSGGQRQRVMIAMALALEPDILIADEPTTALDVTTQAQILDLICRIRAEKGMAVLFITHDFGVVADIADRVIVMEGGRIVEQGAAAQILNSPQHPYTKQLIAAVPRQNAKVSQPENHESILLDVRSLHKVYRETGLLGTQTREVVAVDDVSLVLRKGETLGLVGESGSGKSTLGRCILKLAEIDSGEILLNGQDIAPMTEEVFRPLRKKVQMIFQDPFSSLNPRHTVGRIIMDGSLAHGASRSSAESKARELLSLVGLEPSSFERYPHEFSGGQRQRVGIARALALDPEILVADEAVSALDVSVQAQVLSLLQRLQRQLGIAVLFITHDLRIAAEICDRVAVMYRGKIVEQGQTAQVFGQPQHEYTQRLIAAIPGAAWDNL